MPPLADCFTERPEIGHQLVAALGPGETVLLVPPAEPARPADGRGAGTGKTQLAAWLAESLWRSQRIDMLVWLVASSKDSILTGLAQASAAAGPGPVGDTRQAATRFLDWLSESERRWLVVLDDLADTGVLEGLWPEGAAGRVLVTTETPAGLAGLRSARQLPVGAFAPRESMSYLMARLAGHRDQRIGAADLADDLAGVPLALAQASSVIAGSGRTCREYSEEFARRRAQIREAARAEPSATAVTWTLSLEHADRKAPAGLAQRVLAQASLLDCHGIPGVIFTAGDSEPDPAGAAASAALAHLADAGLVAVDRAAGTVQLNPAVKAAVQQAMPTPMREQAAAQAARSLLRTWPERDADPWLALAFRSCAASLRQAAEASLWAADGYWVLFRAGYSLASAGHTGLALDHWHDLADTAAGVLGSSNAAALTARAEMAGALVAAGRPDEAIPLQEAVADDRARILGPEHADTLAARASLARMLVAAGRGGDAMTLFSRIVAASDQLAGPEHPDTLTALEGLATACLAAGRFREATQLMEHVLKVRERSGFLTHAATLSARISLAEAYCAAGLPKAAIPHYQLAVALRERTLGPRHPDTMAAKAGLAEARRLARRRGGREQ